MLNAERRSRILETLGREGRVIAGELSREFGVSEDTIRRDLRELASDGLLKRVYGGAVPRAPVSPTFHAREAESATAKRAIAAVAAEMLRDGQVVIFDGGTTPLEVARHLSRQRRLTVLTHSLPVASALAEHGGVEVVVLGGTLDKDQLSMVGATTVAGYRQVRADVCVLGVVSVHPELGLGVFDHEDAEVKRAAVAASSEVVVVASGEKLGTSAPFLVGPATVIDQLVTDPDVSDETLAPYRALGINVFRGGTGGVGEARTPG